MPQEQANKTSTNTAGRKDRDETILARVSLACGQKTAMGPLVKLSAQTKLKELVLQCALQLKLQNEIPDNFACSVALPRTRPIETDSAWAEALQKLLESKQQRVEPVRRRLYASLAKQLVTKADRIGWSGERLMALHGIWELAVCCDNLVDMPDALLRGLIDQLKEAGGDGDCTALGTSTKAPSTDSVSVDLLVHALTALWMLVRGVAKGEGRAGARLRAHVRQRLNRLKVVEPVIAIIASSANALLNEAMIPDGGDPSGDATHAHVPDAGQLLASAFQDRKMSSMSGTSLSVQVLSASNLASVNLESGSAANATGSARRHSRQKHSRAIETYVVVQWRDEEVGRTHPAAPTARTAPTATKDATSAHSQASLHDPSDVTWESEPPLQITLPSSDIDVLADPSLGSKLVLTVYKWHPGLEISKAKDQNGTFMGRIVLSGKAIAELLEQQRELGSNDVAYELQPKPLKRPVRDADADPNRFVQGKLKLRLNFEDHLVKVAQVKQLSLSVLNAHRLMSMDKNGSADPYCVVLWDGAELGRSGIVRRSLAPNWGDAKFTKILPSDLTGSKLTVVMYDDDDDGGKFMGKVSFDAASLASLPSSRQEYALQAADPDDPFAGEGDADSDLDESDKSPTAQIERGTLTLQMCVEHKSQIDLSVPSEFITGGADDIPVCTVLTVTVRDIAGLEMEGQRSNSSAFVMVFWNDRLVGRSSTIPNNNSPQWEDERFVIALPPDASNSVLRLEVHHEEQNSPHFLGQVVLTGSAVLSKPRGERFTEVLQRKAGESTKHAVQGEIGLTFEVDEKSHTPAMFLVSSAGALPEMSLQRGKRATLPFCVVRWGGAMIGMTVPPRIATCDPSWPAASFVFPAPADTHFSELTLEIRHHGQSLGQLLGHYRWHGNEVNPMHLSQGNLDISLSPPVDGCPGRGGPGTASVKFTVSGRDSLMRSSINTKQFKKLKGWANKARRRLMEEAQFIGGGTAPLAEIKDATPAQKLARQLAYALGLACTFAWERSSANFRTTLARPDVLATLFALLIRLPRSVTREAEGRLAQNIAADIISNLVASEGFDIEMLLDPNVCGVEGLEKLLLARSRIVTKTAYSALSRLSKTEAARVVLLKSGQVPRFVRAVIHCSNGTFERWSSSHKVDAGWSAFTLHCMQCAAVSFWGAVCLLLGAPEVRDNAVATLDDTQWPALMRHMLSAPDPVVVISAARSVEHLARVEPLLSRMLHEGANVESALLQCIAPLVPADIDRSSSEEQASDAQIVTSTAAIRALLAILTQSHRAHDVRLSLTEEGVCSWMLAIIRQYDDTAVRQNKDGKPMRSSSRSSSRAPSFSESIRLARSRPSDACDLIEPKGLEVRLQRRRVLCEQAAMLLAVVTEYSLAAGVTTASTQNVERLLTLLACSRNREVQQSLLLALFCAAHGQGGQMVACAAKGADVVVQVMRNCIFNMKSQHAFAGDEQRCAEAAMGVVYLLAFNAEAAEMMASADTINVFINTLSLASCGEQRNDRLVSLLLVTLLALLGGVADAQTRDMCMQEEAVSEELDPYAKAQAQLAAINGVALPSVKEVPQEEVPAPDGRPPTNENFARALLAHPRLILLLMRVAIDNGGGETMISPIQARNRMLATSLLLGMDVASEPIGCAAWMENALGDVWSAADRHSDNDLASVAAISTSSSPIGSRAHSPLPTLTGASPRPNVTSPTTSGILQPLQSQQKSYEQVLVYLRNTSGGGSKAESQSEQTFGSSESVRAHVHSHVLDSNMMILIVVLELLFAEEPLLVQYALSALLWISDASSSMRRFIVQLGMSERVFDLCRFSDAVPRHINSTALTLALALAEDDENQRDMAPVALPVLTDLLASRVLEEAWEDHAAACWLLETLKENPANRTQFYKIELGVKARISLAEPVLPRGQVRLHNRLQARVQSAWTSDLGFMSQASLQQGCGAAPMSPFLHTADAHVLPRDLRHIMQGRFVTLRPLAPSELDPPQLYKPRPPPAPSPKGHTIVVETEGEFGQLPPEPVEICVRVHPPK